MLTFSTGSTSTLTSQDTQLRGTEPRVLSPTSIKRLISIQEKNVGSNPAERTFCAATVQQRGRKMTVYGVKAIRTYATKTP